MVEPQPGRRLTREEARLRTRERLLDAAADVFRRLGYGGASLEAVAEAAGYTKGAVYSNFDTKADLYVALLERYVAAESEMQERILAERSLEEFIDSLDQVFSRQVMDDPSWTVLQIEFWIAAARDPTIREKLVARGEEMRSHSGATIDAKLAESGVSSPFTGRELGILLNALATGLALQHQLEPDSIDPRLLVRAARLLAGFDAR